MGLGRYRTLQQGPCSDIVGPGANLPADAVCPTTVATALQACHARCAAHTRIARSVFKIALEPLA